MRNMTTAIAAALAMMAATAAPALACEDYGNPCGRGLFTAGDYQGSYARFEHLPDPTGPGYYPHGPRTTTSTRGRPIQRTRRLCPGTALSGGRGLRLARLRQRLLLWL